MVNINCTLHPGFQTSVLVWGVRPGFQASVLVGGCTVATVVLFITVSLSPFSSLFHCRHFRQAEKCVAYAESLGVDTPGERKRETDARRALGAIRWDIHQLSAKASALDEKRWRWRYRELKAEEGQYGLGDSMDPLKVGLERVLAEGGD